MSIPTGILNNILPGGRGPAPNLNFPKNPLEAVNDILPTGMLSNLTGGSGTIRIVLDNPSCCYYAGTVVSGKVIVQMEKTESIRALTVKIRGGAHVTWNETSTENVQSNDNTTRQEQVTTTYTSEEEYFSNKFNLLGETNLNAGTHTYNFQTPLPPMLPSSFTGEHGGIKYTVKATIDRPWKIDSTSEFEFKVITPMDLNHNAVAKEPVKKEASKNFCCLFCQSGPLTLTVNLPYSGYVAGQTINVAVEADNASNVDINAVSITLNKSITWICHKPSRSEKVTRSELAKVSMEGVPAHGSKAWNQQISLPSDMPYTNIDACSLIKMNHLLWVTAEVGGCHTSLEISAPLIIGTVPIGGSISSFPAGDMSYTSGPYPGGNGYSANNGAPGYPDNSGPGYTSGPAQGYPPAGPGYPPAGPGYPSANSGPGYPPAGPGYPSGPPSAPSAPPDSPTQPLLGPTNIGFNVQTSPPYPS